MIAYKGGIRDITALDIDKEAVKVARDNFENNQCRVNNIKVIDIHKSKISRKYDFVAANIITHELIRIKSKLISLINPGKYLAVSGISIENEKVFRKKFQSKKLKCIKVERGKKWVAILFKCLK